ncbi:MAG: hypothetical protein KC503_41045, partial [Myxococcales bacterium]|nr:hypothetical protein [Myxococcales bacterium]
PPARPSGPAPRVAVNRLFSASARRRHAIQLYATAELGTQLHDAIGMTNAISVGMRINNIFELGGGVRYLVTERAAGNDGFSHRATFFGYMGGNFTLDSGGWVSIPFGVDIGGGKDVKVFGRAKMGIRINPTNWLFVGVYPFNPTYSYIDSQATALSRRNEWTFPTTLEVGFRF